MEDISKNNKKFILEHFLNYIGKIVTDLNQVDLLITDNRNFQSIFEPNFTLLFSIINKLMNLYVFKDDFHEILISSCDNLISHPY